MEQLTAPPAIIEPNKVKNSIFSKMSPFKPKTAVRPPVPPKKSIKTSLEAHNSAIDPLKDDIDEVVISSEKIGSISPNASQTQLANDEQNVTKSENGLLPARPENTSKKIAGMDPIWENIPMSNNETVNLNVTDNILLTDSGNVSLTHPANILLTDPANTSSSNTPVDNIEQMIPVNNTNSLKDTPEKAHKEKIAQDAKIAKKSPATDKSNGISDTDKKKNSSPSHAWKIVDDSKKSKHASAEMVTPHADHKKQSASSGSSQSSLYSLSGPSSSSLCHLTALSQPNPGVLKSSLLLLRELHGQTGGSEAEHLNNIERHIRGLRNSAQVFSRKKSGNVTSRTHPVHPEPPIDDNRKAFDRFAGNLFAQLERKRALENYEALNLMMPVEPGYYRVAYDALVQAFGQPYHKCTLELYQQLAGELGLEAEMFVIDKTPKTDCGAVTPGKDEPYEQQQLLSPGQEMQLGQ